MGEIKVLEKTSKFISLVENILMTIHMVWMIENKTYLDTKSHNVRGQRLTVHIGAAHIRGL